MTQSFPSEEIPSESAPTLQARLIALSELYQETTAELGNKNIGITKLYSRLNDSTNAAKVTISELSKNNKDLERDLRWATQGRDNAEKAEAMAKRELNAYLDNQDTGVRLLHLLTQTLYLE